MLAPRTLLSGMSNRIIINIIPPCVWRSQMPLSAIFTSAKYLPCAQLPWNILCYMPSGLCTWVSVASEKRQASPWLISHSSNPEVRLDLTRWGRYKMAATLADDTFKCKFFNENILISIKISLKFVPKGPINNFQHILYRRIYASLGLHDKWCETGNGYYKRSLFTSPHAHNTWHVFGHRDISCDK